MTGRLPIESRNSTPTFRSAGTTPGDHGMTAQAISAAASTTIGESAQMILSTRAGTMSSLERSLIASATVWSRPNGPTRLGP